MTPVLLVGENNSKITTIHCFDEYIPTLLDISDTIKSISTVFNEVEYSSS